MKVELLYFDDCPSYETAYNTLVEVLKKEGIEAEIEKVNVKTEKEAQKLRFLGSPTIRVDGKDVERKARESTAYGRKCRIYVYNDQVNGWPPKEMLRKAFKGKSKVTLVVAQWCPICPKAEKLWSELETNYKFDYEEVDIASEEGRKLVAEHSIMSVPTTIIDGKVSFSGVPDKDKAIDAVII